MMEQSNAKIFLAKERGKNETGVMRSYKTFNSGNYFNEHKTAFGNLYLLNDDTLAPAETIKMFVEEESYIVFLPVAGGIIYSDSPGHEVTIMAGEAQIKFTLPGTIIEIKNAYEDSLVNYLHIRFRRVAKSACAIDELVSFNIDQNKDQFVRVSRQNPEMPFMLSMIKLGGRSEVIYELHNKKNAVYTYVIEGAFEVQYRLLHERDGLALWEVPEIEAEALSNDAILLIAEVSL
ncbi:hypothetical protein [Terrimonas sp.]|uniref:pirin family protein n=1 Tax=Terrimonas sp. TaxID=1914338 RepID=UPI000E32998B|nr:hypothetical protein [Terrimonas sp.]